jgi:hypothetical protein
MATPEDADTLASFRARNTLVRTIRAQLKGTGLDIRELTNALAISNPGHPEHGRIHITYATADVTHRLTTWNYLGLLQGHRPSHDTDEPTIDTHAIISVLTSPDAPPGHTA